MEDVRAQVHRIMDGIYPGRWEPGLASTVANVDGLGLIVPDVSDSPSLRVGVWLASGVPFSQEMVYAVANFNGNIQFGAVNLSHGNPDTCALMLYYDLMLPWFDDMRVNQHGVYQPLLDVIGNLPVIAAQISDDIVSRFGGRRPDLSEGWSLAAGMLL